MCENQRALKPSLYTVGVVNIVLRGAPHHTVVITYYEMLLFGCIWDISKQRNSNRLMAGTLQPFKAQTFMVFGRKN